MALMGAGGALLVGNGAGLLTGCGYYTPEDGSAYEPWAFPAGETSPERVAVAAAILAASPHNTQPWLFVVRPEAIEVHADMSKSLGAMDPLGREMFVGLGCAVENLALAARANGRGALVSWLPDPARPTLVARIALTAAPPQESPLYAAIAARHTNRGAYLNAPPPPTLEAAMRAQLDDVAVRLTFVGDGPRKASFREGTIAATRAIVADTEMNEASHVWWRQSKEDIDTYRDGLTPDASGVGSLTSAFSKMTPPLSAASMGDYWIDNTKGDQTTGFAFCLLSTEQRGDRAQQLRCGRIYQRLHLWATSQGLSMQPLNQMAERQDREQQRGLPSDFGARLAALTGEATSRAQMLFRIGVSWDDASKSPRRPLSWVVTS